MNDRVLIRPLVTPDVTEGGLVLPENRTDKLVEMQGIVVALGFRASDRNQLKPGDHVVFSWSVGQEISVGDDRYLMLREDDIAAVLE